MSDWNRLHNITNKVCLRKEEKSNERHELQAGYSDDGDLVLYGSDSCQAARVFMGSYDHEYQKIIKKNDICKFLRILNIAQEEDILNYLLANWSGHKSYELERILDNKKIPYELDIW